MDCTVRICQINFIPNSINLIIESKYTYFNTKLTCSFLYKHVSIASFKSCNIDLFEGTQSFSIYHSFTDFLLNEIELVIDIFDEDGIRIGYFRKYFVDDEAHFDSPIEISNKMIRLNEGGIITVNIGGIAFRIHARHDDVLYKCKEYISKDTPVCDVSVSENDIANEKNTLNELLRYPLPDAEIESYAIRNKLAESLLDYNGFQLHGAAIAVDDQCYIFTADSGIGKTTHINLWLSHLPNAYVVNGDLPIIITTPSIRVFGSPWCGKEGMNINVAVPLKAIVIMERSSDNQIIEIDMKEALVELLRQIYKPSNPEKARKTLQLLSSLNGKIRFYRFKFNNFTNDAFDISYGKLRAD